MPVPNEFTQFFTSLVEKSKKSEINWEATAQPTGFRVRFSDFSIAISQEGNKPQTVRIRLLNDNGQPSAEITVNDAEDEWMGAVSLINSADRKVRKIGQTMQRAMEELGKQGPVGLDPPSVDIHD